MAYYDEFLNFDLVSCSSLLKVHMYCFTSPSKNSLAGIIISCLDIHVTDAFLRFAWISEVWITEVR